MHACGGKNILQKQERKTLLQGTIKVGSLIA